MTATTMALTAVVVVLSARPWRRRPLRPTRRGAARPSGLRSAALDARSTRWLIVGIAALSGLVAGGPVAGVLAGSAAVAWAPVVELHRRRRRRAAVAGAVPDLVDLFVVSASAGQPVAGALAVVAPRAPEPVVPLVGAALGRFRRGLPLAECLAELGDDLGPSGVPLTDALRQAASAGVPLVPLLEGVAATVRDQRRRRAQEVARRLPVTMLFPLVACILPAAILLAVVPVLLVSVASLSP